MSRAADYIHHTERDFDMRKELSLAPAKWIWYPSSRTLANTFVLFRKEFELDCIPETAKGFLTADSRYELFVNGKRVQWGPAPCDPHHLDADPVDLCSYLTKGKNVLAVRVLFYGHGEGTWVAGNPGLLFHLTLQNGGQQTHLCSDGTWMCRIDRAHRAGQFQREYLRSLQEEYDNRLAEENWLEPDFSYGPHWKNAMVTGERADRPSIYTAYGEYLNGGNTPTGDTGRICERMLPMPVEEKVPVKSLVESGRVYWDTDPNDWFYYRSPGCYRCEQDPTLTHSENGRLVFRAQGGGHYFLTFDLKEQIVGFPYLTINAPEGTTVEIISQESHTPFSSNMLLDTGFHCWSRLICKKGINRFQCFDFESLKWIQLHISVPKDADIVLSDLGVLRRKYPYRGVTIHSSDAKLQRLFDAGINTLYNAAIETLVDGMGRERQQYSGDGSHALVSLRNTMGNYDISKRFLYTFADGLTPDGYFLDCYPAIDRVKRVAFKQIGTTDWGPIIDHSVGFVGDCSKYALETGDLDVILDLFPKLETFLHFLMKETAENGGLFPAETQKEFCVWMDHEAYERKRHRLGSINLYICGMMYEHWIPLLKALGKDRDIPNYQAYADALKQTVIEQFWDPEREIFVDNLPWLEEEGGEIKVSDRTLAMAILYHLCPGDNRQACGEFLAHSPAVKRSYPCNAVWRQWALADLGYADEIVKDLRDLWANMPSVTYNNTYQENWNAPTDTTEEWSHIPQAPIIALSSVFAGVHPTSPAFQTFEMNPQLSDLGDLTTTVTTVSGDILFEATMSGKGSYAIHVEYPAAMSGVLKTRSCNRVAGLQELEQKDGWSYFALPNVCEYTICYGIC